MAQLRQFHCSGPPGSIPWNSVSGSQISSPWAFWRHSMELPPKGANFITGGLLAEFCGPTSQISLLWAFWQHSAKLPQMSHISLLWAFWRHSVELPPKVANFIALGLLAAFRGPRSQISLLRPFWRQSVAQGRKFHCCGPCGGSPWNCLPRLQISLLWAC